MTYVDESVHAAWPAQPPDMPPTAGYPPMTPSGASGWAPGQVPPLPPSPPASGGSGKSSPGPIIAVAVIAVLALLAGAFVAGMKVVSNSSDTASAPSSSSSTTKPPASSTTPPSTAGNSPSTTAPSSGGSSGGADAQAVKAEVDQLKTYVEKDRGLKYRNDVDVTVLSPDDFKARVLSEVDKEKDQLQQQGQLLQALGLIPADADPVAIQRDLLGVGVLGFYDPESKALVVGNTKITPMWDEIMTHELTHALDDQNFNLNRPDIDNSTDGRADAWHALVEGNARRVEYDYVRSLPKDKQQAIAQEELSLGLSQQGSSSNVPIALVQIIQSPYDYGEPFVRALLQDKQQAGLDAAFVNPPTSTEQILQPEKFENKDDPKAVDKPPADGAVITDGTLGELMTGFALNGPIDQDDIMNNLLGGGAGNLGSGDPSDLLNGLLGSLGGLGDPSGSGSGSGSTDPSDALSGLLGGMLDDPTQLNSLDGLVPKADQVKNWGGDHFVLYHSGSDLCVRVDWTMDSAQDLSTFSGQLDAWAGKDSKVKVDHPSTSVVRATRCVASSGGTSSGNPGI